jgi:predicted transcriptional regulator
MTKEEIQAILERVTAWPLDRQEDLARMALTMEEVDGEEFDLTEEDWADLEEGVAEADRGEFASEEEVKSLLDLYR